MLATTARRVPAERPRLQPRSRGSRRRRRNKKRNSVTADVTIGATVTHGLRVEVAGYVARLARHPRAHAPVLRVLLTRQLPLRGRAGDGERDGRREDSPAKGAAPHRSPTPGVTASSLARQLDQHPLCEAETQARSGSERETCRALRVGVKRPEASRRCPRDHEQPPARLAAHGGHVPAQTLASAADDRQTAAMAVAHGMVAPPMVITSAPRHACCTARHAAA